MTENRYPSVGLRSKNEIAKRLCDKDSPKEKNQELITYCLKNFDNLWRDHRTQSKPDKLKWVRNASYSQLGKLHKMINRKIFAQYDCYLPNIIHGGVSKKSTKSAAKALLGTQRCRTLLKIDMRRFYEHVSDQDVMYLFQNRLGCSYKAAKIFTALCCVHEGPKNNPSPNLTLARGFATSSRLAVWCNLDLFLQIFWLIEKTLKGHDPKIVIYVDDIYITASRVTPQQMADLYYKITKLVNNFKGGKLEINSTKTTIVSYLNRKYDLKGNDSGFAPYEALGIHMKRNNLALGVKTKSKLTKLKRQQHLNPAQRRTKKGLLRYMRYIPC